MFLSNMPFTIATLGRYIPNLTNAGFVVGGFFFLVALRRQGFLERVPLALQTVYQSMQDGVIVFDAARRIASVNPTAISFSNAHTISAPETSDPSAKGSARTGSDAPISAISRARVP